jgi:flavin reductase (DIM6/NTAB) family NADH-FMN oxidoreductase RutF
MTALAKVDFRRSVSANEPALVEADGAVFRAAMRQLASGVSVITHGVGAESAGLTATSVSSLSAEPPSLVVCVNRAASSYSGLVRGAPFGVSVLGADQQEISDRFAGRTDLKGVERFRDGRWFVTPSGVRLLGGSAAAFECEVEEILERHTHAIIVGGVRRAVASPVGGALVYWRGAYDRLGWTADELSRAVGQTPRNASR